jgi:hypothetical protein
MTDPTPTIGVTPEPRDDFPRETWLKVRILTGGPPPPPTPNGPPAGEPDDLSPWWILVRPLPRDVPAAIRVRRFLKAALRAYGLKCEGIRAKPPDGPGGPNVTSPAN